MIRSSSQVMLADGRQQISFNLTTVPTTALINWTIEYREKDEIRYIHGSKTVPVVLEGSLYLFRSIIPSEIFTVKLDSESRSLRYETEWGESKPEDTALLELYSATSPGYVDFKVPYCDLSTVDVRLFTSTMVPLDTWESGRKKPWSLWSILIDTAYGGRTLIAHLYFKNPLVKERGGANWIPLSELPGGYVVEVFNISKVTTDIVVNATVCRESLYGKVYRRVIA